MVDGVGTTVYTYTAGNQLLTEDGPFASDTVTNTYLNRMRVGLVLAQPAGFWTNGFAYDPAQRLTNVTMSAGSFSYSYGASPLPLAATLPSQILLPNGAYIANTYDASARLTGTYLENSTNAVLDSYAYVYNQANQRTQLTRADSSTMGFSFDNIGQLSFANDSNDNYDVGYGYDAAWNLSLRTNYWGYPPNAVESFTNDVKNELTGLSGELWQYDANGNVTNRDDGVNILFQYSWDDENRLTFMEYDDCGTPYYQLNQLVYDGLGRLRQMAEYSWDGAEWVPSVGKGYIYDGMRVIQERDENNTPLVSYTRGRDLSGTFEGAGGIGGLLARSDGYDSGTGNWTSNAFYFADGNGNITYLTDDSQGLAASYKYDPFGHEMSATGPLAAENSYRFSSKEMFAKNLEWYGAIYYFGYRFYDPNWQRWLNRDPIGERGGMNLYRFCDNTPITSVDRNGRIVYVTSHTVYGSPYSHTTILIVPDNPQDFADDSRFAVGPDGNPYTTIGAERKHGKLVSNLLRPPDKPCPRNKALGMVTPKDEKVTDTDFIRSLLAADANYPDNLAYTAFPDPGENAYNSNSYTSGLVNAAGGDFPPVMQGNIPGFNNPVPSQFFQP
jgi:RHS repeat-associated protein